MKQPVQFGMSLILGLCVWVSSATAQDLRYNATLYGWLAGIGTKFDTARGQVDRSISFSDVLEDLDGAFMGVFEVQYGRMSYIADLQYTKTKSGGGSPLGFLFSGSETETRLKVASTYALYRVSETTQSTIDLGVGLRYSDLDVELRLTPGTLPAESLLRGDSFTDPVLALRFSHALSDDWDMTGFFDLGGIGVGSDMTWQALVAFRYQINDGWSARLGYRHLAYDGATDSGDLDVQLSGPIFGVTYQF